MSRSTTATPPGTSSSPEYWMCHRTPGSGRQASSARGTGSESEGAVVSIASPGPEPGESPPSPEPQPAATSSSRARATVLAVRQPVRGCPDRAGTLAP